MTTRRANEDVWMDWPRDDHSDVVGIRAPKRKTRTGNVLRAAVFARDGYSCRYCGRACVDPPETRGHSIKTGTWPDNTRTIEHVLPRSRGDTSTLENLVVACVRCNLRKGNKTLAEAGMVLLGVVVREI